MIAIRGGADEDPRMGFSVTDLEALPVDVIAWRILRDLAPDRPGAARRDLVIKRYVNQVDNEGRSYDAPACERALAEAWGYLERHGLIVQWPARDPRYTDSGQREMYRVSRLGLELVRLGDDGPKHLAARQRLGVELHPALRDKLRTLVVVGAFEQATLIALRAVEARVRLLAGDPRKENGSRLVGVALMQAAFKASGPLADPDAEPAEQQGTMNLFAGAFGAVRNAVAHTEDEWVDPTEAAEMVLLADLLMRQLDRVEQRLRA